MLERVKLRISKKLLTTILICIALFAVAYGTRVYDLNGTGATWDEWGYHYPSLVYYKAITEGSASEDYWKVNNEHPPLVKYLYVYAYSKDQSFLDMLHGKTQRHNYFTGTPYTNARKVSALLNALTVLVLFVYARRYWGLPIAIVASSILTFLPHFLGHGKIAALDSPTTFFYVLAVFGFHYAIEKDTWKTWGLAWLLSGLAISTKYSNFTIFLLFGLLYLIWRWPKVKENPKNIWYWKTALLPIVALLILYLMWPWLWYHPIDNFQESVSHWTGSPPKEFFLGIQREAPLHYFIVYFFATTPLLVLLLIFPGIWRLVKKRSFKTWLLLLWFLIPFLWSFSTGIQDGIRYIYVIFPPLALVAAVGWRKLPRWRWQVFAIVMASLLLLSVRIHPYYIDYYNPIVGGPKGVYEGQLFEFGWWGEGKKEMIDWVNGNVPPNALVGTKFSPYIDLSGWRSDVRYVDLELLNYSGHLDYVVTNTYWEWFNAEGDKYPIYQKDLENYKVVHTIDVMGAPLVKIYKT
ncbi:hypothetical protein CMO91_02355 [Candidatus Woesearchaeota archaeon]|nr:hypothetical protein [Candidatus Woesearchaeota archaeon]